MPLDTQEALALFIVAAIVALALWRRAKRRASGSAGCANCDQSAAKPREAPLRFYRRKP